MRAAIIRAHGGPEAIEVADESVKSFLGAYMSEFRDHLVRVLTVLPRRADAAASTPT